MLNFLRKLFKRKERIVSVRYKQVPQRTIDNEFHRKLMEQMGWL